MGGNRLCLRAELFPKRPVNFLFSYVNASTVANVIKQGILFLIENKQVYIRKAQVNNEEIVFRRF